MRSDTTGVGTVLLNVEDRLAAADAAAATVDEVADTGVTGTLELVVFADSPLLLWLTGGRGDAFGDSLGFLKCRAAAAAAEDADEA